MNHHDVFVSYSSQDKAIADAACATLEARGIRCWVAPRDITPGQDWSEAIIDAIAACRVFLLILSGASNQSEQVKREVQNAVSEAKSILPFRVEDVALSKHMRYFIGTPHWLDALTPPMERHLQRMAETVAIWIVSLDSKGGETGPVPLAPLPSPVPYAAEGVPVAPPPHILRPDVVAAAEKALAHFIGPMARVLVKRAAQTAADTAGFHHLLAEHLPTPAEREEFRRKVQH